MSVYASPGTLGALSSRSAQPVWENPLGAIKRLPPGVEWQPGIGSIEMSRGDILVMAGMPRALSNILLLLKARLKGVKTVWWAHYRSSTSKSWRVSLRLKLLCLADLALFYTDEEILHFRQRRVCDPSLAIDALNNGIDNSVIRSIRVPYEARRREPRILFIGRLTKKSALDVLLKAVSQPVLKGVLLDVIGDGERRETFERYAEALGIRERVNWHGATTDETAIANIANSCRIFVYPGAVGLSIVHALNYGLPVVVHDDRWLHMPEIAAFSDGENGLSFARGDSKSLSDTIFNIIHDSDRLDAMSRVAITTTEESFNIDDMVSRFNRVIRALENQRKKGGVLPNGHASGSVERKQ